MQFSCSTTRCPRCLARCLQGGLLPPPPLVTGRHYARVMPPACTVSGSGRGAAAILAKVKKNVPRRPSWLAAAAKESRSGGGGTAGGVRPPADCRPSCLASSGCRTLASHGCSEQSEQSRSAAVLATILATGRRNESETGRQQMLVGEF